MAKIGSSRGFETVSNVSQNPVQYGRDTGGKQLLRALLVGTQSLESKHLFIRAKRFKTFSF